MCNIQRPLAAVYLFHWFRFRFAVCSIKGEITKHYGWVGLATVKPLVYGHTPKSKARHWLERALTYNEQFLPPVNEFAGR